MIKMHTSELGQKEVIDTIRRLAHMAEYREPGTLNHLERMRGYCYILARGAGLAGRDAEVIAHASQLHDVGKVGIPEEITFKAGNLTPYDWEVIQRHAQVGADILRGASSTIMQAGEIICLTHHERWDGSGYPRGLRGEEIPLSGRIVAIADVFDALTTKRNYKPQISPEEALQLINEASGQLFDPELVKVFNDHFDEILRVRRNYP
jgi:putative two-component system response regulator